MIVGFTTMTKIMAPSSKGVTSLTVAIGIMLTIKAIFFQVNTPLMGLRFTLIPKTHRQARNTIVNGYYYDKETGAPHAVPRNQFIEIDDDLYYFDSEGKPLTGKKIIDGKEYYFRENGSARRGGL